MLRKCSPAVGRVRRPRPPCRPASSSAIRQHADQPEPAASRLLEPKAGAPLLEPPAQQHEARVEILRMVRQLQRSVEAQLARGEVGATCRGVLAQKPPEDRARHALDEVFVAEKHAVVARIVAHGNRAAGRRPRPLRRAVPPSTSSSSAGAPSSTRAGWRPAPARPRIRGRSAGSRPIPRRARRERGPPPLIGTAIWLCGVPRPGKRNARGCLGHKAGAPGGGSEGGAVAVVGTEMSDPDRHALARGDADDALRPAGSRRRCPTPHSPATRARRGVRRLPPSEASRS